MLVLHKVRGSIDALLSLELLACYRRCRKSIHTRDTALGERNDNIVNATQLIDLMSPGVVVKRIVDKLYDF